MRYHIQAFVGLVAIAFAAHAGVPVSRTVDVSATIKPIALESYAGETLDLSVQLASGGSPLATPSASATIYWQTNGMANAWWQTNMSCSASGLVTGAWSPGLPSGRVWFFVGVESSGLNYRIAGQCSILPSPGGAPSTAVLPPPGGTLNLGDYTIIGAPWITSADSAAAIASATDPLASEISALSERAASAATSASNYTDSVAAPLIAATNSITARLDSIVIPDVSGFASKTSLQAASNSLAEAVQQSSNALAQATASLAQTVSDNAQQSTSALISATNSLHTSLAPTIQLASTALQPAASNALAQAIAALAQTVADNAQQSAYDLAAASNALAQSTSALAQTVADNAQQSAADLVATSNALAQATATLSGSVDAAAAASTNYTDSVAAPLISATNSLSQSIAANAQQSAYDLAAASNALAQATAALSGSVYAAAAAATNYTDSVAGSVAAAAAAASASLSDRIDGLSISLAASNTAFRLMSIDGSTYQDATGTVWHTETTIGTSQWHVVAISYTNGTTVATNEIPGLPSWSIDGDYNGDSDPKWIWILRVPAGGSEYSQIGGAEDATPADMNLEFVLSGGEISSLSFARTNTVSHYWAPVDHVLYSSSGGGGGGITTNDVCNIVTNVVTTDEWIYTGLPDGAIIHYPPEYMGNEWWSCVMSYNGDNYDGSWDGPGDSTFMTFRFVNVTTPGGEDYIVSAEHRFTVRNALGLALDKDLPQNTPVDELLLNGSDGKVYHLRIGAGGSIDIYTEVSP